MNFENFAFHPEVAAGVVTAGYDRPTPIQADAMPPVMQGRDVMGLAQTGTGKTAAFALPILNRLMKGKRGCVRALVIAPTRELAEQIHQAFEDLGEKTGLKSMSVYGGVGINPQKQKLRNGVDIVVACPGRLLDHMGQKTVNLSRLEVLVLDEADMMFDMGFFPYIRRIILLVPRDRQPLLFSATRPKEIRRLANEVLRNPVTIQAGAGTPAETVSHALYPIKHHQKTALLMELLRHTDTESVLVFTRTKHRAKRVGRQLVQAGFRATSLQGNLTQGKRQTAMNGFRDGTYQIMVATDIAARGIDVTKISHVINYDIPSTPDAYIHRIGRTGRATRSGDAFTMITEEDAGMVRAIDRVLGACVERRTLPGFDYNAPVRQFDKKPVGKPKGGGRTWRSSTPSASQASKGQASRKKRYGRTIPLSAGASRPTTSSHRSIERGGKQKRA
jgi:ATP-dependent RNA helicase RhlE